jgi:hypothetical protein
LENTANYIFLATIIAICLLTLRIMRHPKAVSVRDPGEAIVEFGNVFPDEAVRSVLMDKEGRTTFMRLADGKTGLTQVVGKTYVVRLIQPGEIGVSLTDDGAGLILNFEEGSAIGGVYEFLEPQDAAEVSLWICGSFGLKMAETKDNV